MKYLQWFLVHRRALASNCYCISDLDCVGNKSSAAWNTMKEISRDLAAYLVLFLALSLSSLPTFAHIMVRRWSLQGVHYLRAFPFHMPRVISVALWLLHCIFLRTFSCVHISLYPTSLCPVVSTVSDALPSSLYLPQHLAGSLACTAVPKLQTGTKVCRGLGPGHPPSLHTIIATTDSKLCRNEV